MNDDIVYDEDTLFVKRLFAERDAAYIASTQLIVDVIAPTVLEALYEVFNVPTDDVKWLDFQTTENLLIVLCSVSFNPHEGIPEFIEDTIDSIPTENRVVEQTIRIGIPYEIVLADPEEIVAFLEALVDSHNNGGPTLIDYKTTIMEPSELTHDHSLTTDQIIQMMALKHTTKGKLH